MEIYKVSVIFLFFRFFMKKLLIFLSAIPCVFIWFSFAAPSILNPTYAINWNDVKIFWADNSNWWYLDVNLQDPTTNDWLHFGEVKMSDQTFTYTKQWEWEQKIRIIPWDWWDEIRFTIPWDKPAVTDNSETVQDQEKPTANRTVIQAVPKTWPSGSLIGIIIATLAIFGGYIYIKKRADI